MIGEMLAEFGPVVRLHPLNIIGEYRFQFLKEILGLSAAVPSIAPGKGIFGLYVHGGDDVSLHVVLESDYGVYLHQVAGDLGPETLRFPVLFPFLYLFYFAEMGDLLPMVIYLLVLDDPSYLGFLIYRQIILLGIFL